MYNNKKEESMSSALDTFSYHILLTSFVTAGSDDDAALGKIGVLCTNYD
jgi:hypothetical protein